MKKINFIMGLHCHQPVGNFDWVFEDAYKRAYLPFIETIEKYPSLKFVFHYSGCLLEWLEEHKPEFFARLRALVSAGRCELMSGGFYEPIFPLIPEKDRVGQIKHMNAYIKKMFGYEPSGAWLTERVWEPALAKSLALAGVNYAVVDDTHFEGAGLKEDQMHGYFVTEDEGYTLNIFPINAKMRYFIPFRMPEETEKYLAAAATEAGDRVVTIADDGEKFGIWPDTHEWVYGKKWLEKFFDMLDRNKEWLITTTFADCVKNLRPLGRVYMPTSSYKEMLEWAMPAESILEFEKFTGILKERNEFERFGRFVKGGLFRNFLAKYPESNNMQKKMLYVSAKANALDSSAPGAAEALRLMWSGQCNCAYWHGVFGGLYLNHLRFAIYRRLINAEILADSIRLGRKSWLECEETDFDKDNRPEVLLNSNLYNIYIDPDEGGNIFEFDIKQAGFNALDTLSRRREAYHEDLFKDAEQGGGTGHDSIHDLQRKFDEGLKKELCYDSYRRVSFIDHFCPANQETADFARKEYKEVGDFTGAPYAYKLEKGRDSAEVTLVRDGKVWGNDFRVTKTVAISANDPVIKFSYEIVNKSKHKTSFKFVPEFNFAMLGGDSPDRYYMFDGKKPEDSKLCGFGRVNGVSAASITDEWLNLRINFRFEGKTEVWRMPVSTISQSIGKLEKVYQSSALCPAWALELAPGAVFKTAFCLEVKSAG